MNSTADSAVEHSAKLQRHPADRASPVTSIDVRVCRTPAALLHVTYSIRGDLDSVRVPLSGERRIAEGLWQHTCCELFLRVQRMEVYHEFNFSPSGAWAAHAFRCYRQGGLLRDEALDPAVRMSGTGSVLELRATVALSRLSPAHAGACLTLGISAVIEARDGSRSYWALAHPADQPDFHHPGAFALQLDAVRH